MDESAQFLPQESPGKSGTKGPRKAKDNYPIFIKDWRIYRELSQRDLAKAMRDLGVDDGASYATVSRIERKVTPYTMHQLEGIARILGVTPADLLDHGPEDHNHECPICSNPNAGFRRMASAAIRSSSENQ